MRRLCILLAALAAFAPDLEARDLHWRELAVRAELDAEGRLLVQETQTMVFDGDWNGGERVFRLEPGQKLEFHSIDRIDPERGRVPLVHGDLSEVDHWDMTDRRTVRWRSRLPSDPPFDDAVLVYTLTYALSDILVPRDDGYLLDHDFAFTDRYGVIERFVLDLSLAPEWSPSGPFEGHRELSHLPPGLGAIVTVPLTHAEDRPLAGVTRPLDDAWRHVALVAVLAGMAAMLLEFLRRERALERFEAGDAPPVPTPAWIEEHVLTWLPEQVGALWDERIGPPEVAALIARLVSEGKLASSVERTGRFFKRHVLKLDLLVERDELKGYEKKLVRKLFFDGRSRVSTEQLKKHYRTSGFSPAATIRRDLERSIERRSSSTGPEKPSYKRTLYLFLAAVASGVAALAWRPEPVIQWGLLAGAGWAVLYFSGLAGARRWRYNVFGLRPRLLYFVAPALLLALAYWLLPTIFAGGHATIAPRHLGLLALALLTLGSFSSLLNQAATRVPVERLRLRRRLFVVREAWKAELEREAPALSDDLFPYLVAFGLGRRVDRWFRRFGGAATSSRLDPSVARPTSHASPWTGGGGSFGGGGATSAWTVAATGMASGVTAASSGSGGGGGGGGGSSSGGGGGGGW